MKTTYIYLAVIAIIVYNGMIIKRDQKMFEAYDRVCATLSQPHPDCRYTK